ncbi:MAG: OPT/YSL family transporter, partial [Candidatus Thermoplasmatota archaeon]
RKQWVWKTVLVGLIIGLVFTVINQYVGLKIGMIVGGNWFLTYIIGLALRWRPEEINISAGCSTGASATCTGFVFTYPAIFLLAYHSDYLGKGGVGLISKTVISPESLAVLAILATIIGGMLGVLYFTIFRRIWLIEDPLPVPGFEGTIKMMDMAYDISKGAIEKALRTLKMFCAWFAASFAFAFIRDFPLILHEGERIPIFDRIFLGSKWYRAGDIIQPYETDVYTYTHLGFSLSPLMFASGWFMRFRSAFIVFAGSGFAWFVVVPLALIFQYPFYYPRHDAFYSLLNVAPFFGKPSGAVMAHVQVAIPIGIGIILGGGITAILKMSHLFKSFAKDILKLRGGERKDFVVGRGWYEWPYSHIPLLMIVTLLGTTILFIAYGYPPMQSFSLGIVMVVVTLFISAIAVKTMGEIRSTPVSACSFITLMLLVGIFWALGTDVQTLLVMALVGTAVFGSAVSLSADIIGDFKIGVYCGTRPYHLIKGELTGLVPGAFIAVTAATVFSIGLATEKLQLIAPQARAFAGFSQALMGGAAPGILIALGFFIGIFMEIITGMGTSFGLGLYFPLPVSLTILLGGAMRNLWEAKWLEPKAKAERWDDRTKTMKLIDTYIICIGLVVGEALLGTIVAIYMIFGG